MSGSLIEAVVAALLFATVALVGSARGAIERMTPSRAARLEAEGRPGASTLSRLLTDADRVWATLTLVGAGLFGTAVALTASALNRELGGRTATVLVAVIATVAGYVAVALIPRSVSRRSPESAACRAAGTVRLLSLLLRPAATPLVWIGGRLRGDGEDVQESHATEEVIRDLLDEAQAEEIEPAERKMIHSIFELGDTLVREIMVPRPDVVMVSANMPLEEVIEIILAHGYSRIPVHVGEDRDDIQGLLYAKDVLQRIHVRGDEQGPWLDLVRTPYVVPELKSVDGLLRELQAQQVHLAIVIDEYGGLAGVVTIEDVLEEIVGEIVDEYDSEEELVEQVREGVWRIDARLPIDDLAELVGVDLTSDEWDTVGGLLFGKLGHVPRPGEAVTVQNLRITAQHVRGRRIAEVGVELLEPDDAPTANAADADGAPAATAAAAKSDVE